MRLCQLISSYERSSSPFSGIDPYPDAARWLPEHEWSTCYLDKATALGAVDELICQGFDAFVNLCDGEPEEDIAGEEVCARLAQHGVPFTGADLRSARFGSSRRRLKEACAALGLDTPAYAFLARGEAPQRGALRFPILVKPPNGYASLGIERQSRVETEAELRAACERTMERFGGALLEEFVEGPEFTVLAAEPAPGEAAPLTYRPMEVRFPPGETFKHFELKWTDYEQMALRPVSDPALDRRLRAIVTELFAAHHGVGYWRCDLRMDRDGRLLLLDCNTTPGMFYAPEVFGCADLIVAQEEGGHARFLRHLLRCAQHRAALRPPPARGTTHSERRTP